MTNGLLARDVAPALAALNAFFDTPATVPVRSHVRLAAGCGALTLTRTDHEHQLAIELPWSGPNFEATAACDVLDTVIRQLDPATDVQLTGDGAALRIRAGFELTLPSLALHEFPAFEIKPVAPPFELSAEDAGSALSVILPFASADETRYQLNGIFVHRRDEGLVFVATDSHRLCWTSIPAPDGPDAFAGAILHRRAVKAVLRAVADTGKAVRFAFGEHMARIEIGNRTLFTKLIGVPFPDYRELVPTDRTGRITFDPRHLLGLAKLAETLGGGDKMKILRMEPYEERLTYLGSGGRMTAPMDADSAGALPKLFGVDARHLRDFAEHADVALTLLLSEDPAGLILVETGDERLTGLLIPARID